MHSKQNILLYSGKLPTVLSPELYRSRFLEAMEQFATWRSALKASAPVMSSTHPSTPQRIELAKRHARGLGPPTKGKRERDRYLKGVDGMLFGDSAKEGFVRGSKFSHVKLNITFSVPNNFDLTNRAEAVLASGPGETALRFDAVTSRSHAGAVPYLKSGWVNGLLPDTVEPRTVNGFDAAVGRAQTGDWQFVIAVIEKDKRYFRFILAAPRQGGDIANLAESIFSSFRSMARSERAKLKPLRIRVVKVKSRDTIASLAARMEGVSRKELLFRALNGLSPGQKLKAGQMVKLVKT